MSDRIVSPDDWVPITLGAGEVNLYTLSGTRKRNASALIPTGNGTIVVTMAGSAGVSRTLPVNTGIAILGDFVSVVSVSGPTALHAAYAKSAP